ncbi:MucR family transcriptional regulator [Tianweitania sp. BSSL-BM11]|uniref:MucR family transcriptional regulator n=1 Tax=Tianweitania aestuarii TaxID=2814886 RepID=A0ABS5RSM6_9HYPH|nr:MucR family transcriptional regulator [Tianweitania aestuarii]MBS9719296.1 MucR family transcriptional regulator [Tianweitania aestuarii]
MANDVEELDNSSLAELTADIVSAYVSKNAVRSNDLPLLISDVHAALAGLRTETKAAEPVEAPKPAVPIKKSITPDYLISLENGQKFRSLKRHLMTSYGMTPDDYRTKWGLPADYPMVAPNYAAQRSELAKSLGLGRKASEDAPETRDEPEPAPAPKKRGRKPKAAATETSET